MKLVSKRKDRAQMEMLTGVACAALVVCMFVVSSIDRFVLRSNQYAAVVAAVLVDLANGDRAQQQIGGLTVNPVLTAAAQAKADDMAAKGYFAHVSPDGKDSWYWFKQAGYAFSYAGENLAVDFSDSGDVNTAWMNSPSHRENILNGHFTEIGIATAAGSYEGHPTIFVVQMFGAPAQTAAVAAATPEPITSPKSATDMAIASKPGAQTAPTPPSQVLGESAQKTPAKAPVVQPPAETTPSAAATHYAPAWGYFLTSPKTTLRYVYYLIAFFVILGLLITTELEFRWHHRRAFVIALCLLVFMSAMFVAADRVVFSNPILASTASQTT